MNWKCTSKWNNKPSPCYFRFTLVSSKVICLPSNSIFVLFYYQNCHNYRCKQLIFIVNNINNKCDMTVLSFWWMIANLLNQSIWAHCSLSSVILYFLLFCPWLSVQLSPLPPHRHFYLIILLWNNCGQNFMWRISIIVCNSYHTMVSNLRKILRYSKNEHLCVSITDSVLNIS